MFKSFLKTATLTIALLCTSVSLASATGFSISQPAQNSSLQGNVVTIKFSLPENFRFSASPLHTRPVYGEGHLHLWLDTPNLSPSSAIHVNSDTYIFENIKYGSHTLTAEWVSNNDTRSTPPIVSSVSFTTVPIPTISQNLPARHFIQSLFLIAVLAITSLFLISHSSPAKIKTKKAKKKTKK